MEKLFKLLTLLVLFTLLSCNQLPNANSTINNDEAITNSDLEESPEVVEPQPVYEPPTISEDHNPNKGPEVIDKYISFEGGFKVGNTYPEGRLTYIIGEDGFKQFDGQIAGEIYHRNSCYYDLDGTKFRRGERYYGPRLEATRDLLTQEDFEMESIVELDFSLEAGLQVVCTISFFFADRDDVDPKASYRKFVAINAFVVSRCPVGESCIETEYATLSRTGIRSFKVELKEPENHYILNIGLGHTPSTVQSRRKEQWLEWRYKDFRSAFYNE